MHTHTTFWCELKFLKKEGGAMKTELKVLALGAVLLSGCGSYSSNQESSVSAVLTVNRTEILMGNSIELDASQSVADKLSWTMNGVALSSCGELSICTLAINEKGVYEISVEASSLNSKTTAVTAFVTVSVTEKISAKTASASGSSVAESSNTPAREPVLDRGRKHAWNSVQCIISHCFS